jgi:hypothetical protein
VSAPDLPGSVQVALAGWRSQATQLDAVATDMERAGIAAPSTRMQAATLRELADDFEASERALLVTM